MKIVNIQKAKNATRLIAMQLRAAAVFASAACKRSIFSAFTGIRAFLHILRGRGDRRLLGGTCGRVYRPCCRA